ncbi:MAG: SDR family oxidoreductase [Deltaproteobacteria bacterium]|nr:SDR family oxidoreductase [Deltaproteobacteria bacterium]
MNILVTGGAGYVGSVLIPELLKKNHSVRVLDNLMYGGRGLIPSLLNKNFELIRGDVREKSAVEGALKGIDLIIHLAAIVGYPACKKNPDLARSVNCEATFLLEKTRDKNIPILFGSTGSNYGAVTSQVCTEETPLNPISLYGETKTKAEQHLMNSGNVICYRFATAFGASNRMRLDLLINDFVYQAVRNKNMTVYEKNFKRTFIHVQDMVRSFLFAIDNYSKLKDNVYNVGSEKMNYSKEEIALIVKKKVDYYLHFAEFGSDEDKRNYEVSYRKINALGFDISISMEDGIDELIKVSSLLDIHNEYSNV